MLKQEFHNPLVNRVDLLHGAHTNLLKSEKPLDLEQLTVSKKKKKKKRINRYKQAEMFLPSFQQRANTLSASTESRNCQKV